MVPFCQDSSKLKMQMALQAGSGRSKHGSNFPQGVSVALQTRKTKADDDDLSMTGFAFSS